MSRRLRAGRGGRGRGGLGGSGAAVALEAPLLISDLAAWYDSRTDDYFTLNAGAVSAWASRAGTMGATPLSQATGLSQPARATGVAVLGNQQAVLFDGTDDFLQAATAADWAFMHNNTGATILVVERVDSTGPATQSAIGTMSNSTVQNGLTQQSSAVSLVSRIGNGSGTLQNSATYATAAHYARDVSRWRAWSYGGAVQRSYVSGSTLTNADGAGVPAVGNPEFALRVGRGGTGTTSLKGYIAQILVYKRVLTAGEVTTLATWAATQYGVTV